MFLRFTVGERDAQSHSLKGLFTAAYELRDSGRLSVEAMDQLQELIDWFKKHLPVPDCYGRTDAERAICWFTENAGEPLTKIWRLADLLKTHGREVWLHKTRDPGRRLYRDLHQVVAIPQRGQHVRTF